MCATLSGNSEITFYCSKLPVDVKPQSSQSTQKPRYPWHWKFRFTESGRVEVDKATDLNWNEELTNWARFIVSSPMESLSSQDGKVKICDYFDVKNSQFIHNTNDKIDFRVYLPPGTKECWDALHKEKEQRNWIVSGSPGIGKSISTVYYLRLLMEEKALIIIYDMRKQKDEPMLRWYLFILHDNGYIASQRRLPSTSQQRFGCSTESARTLSTWMRRMHSSPRVIAELFL